MEEPIVLLNDLERLNSEMDVLLSDINGKDDSSASRIRSLERQLAESRLLLKKVSLAAEEKEKAILAELAVYKSDNIARSAEIGKFNSATVEFKKRAESLSILLEGERTRAREKDAFLAEARAALKDKEKVMEAREKAILAELSAAKADNTVKAAEIEKFKGAAAEFQKRMESLYGLLEEEKARAREKDVFLTSAKSALKDKEDEVSRIWAMLEEVKREAAALKARLQAGEGGETAAEESPMIMDKLKGKLKSWKNK